MKSFKPYILTGNRVAIKVIVLKDINNEVIQYLLSS
jgi:hypothetical protein